MKRNKQIKQLAAEMVSKMTAKEKLSQMVGMFLGMGQEFLRSCYIDFQVDWERFLSFPE